MIDLIAYLQQFVNSFIRCIERVLSAIWYIPILGTNLGNIIFGLIILKFAYDLLTKWILGKYNSDHNKGKESENK